MGPSRKGDVLARYEKQQQQQLICPCIEIKETTGRLNTKARYKRRGAQGISPSVVNQPPSDSVALKISLE